MKEGQPVEEATTERLHLTHRVLRLFTNPDMVALLPALEAINRRLQRYAEAKDGEWRRKCVDYHMIHARGHFAKADDERKSHETFVTNLTAFNLRGLMAAARYEELCEHDPHGKLHHILLRDV